MFAQWAVLAALATPFAGDGPSYFQGNFEEAVAKAKAEKKPILVDFFTEWCGWCKRLDKDTLADAAVAAYLKDYVNLKIDAEKGEGPALAKNFAVPGFPTLIVVDGSGEEVDRIGGYMKPADFLKTLKEFQSGNSFQSLQKQLAKTPSDTKVQFAMAGKWKERGQTEKAKELLGKVIAADASGKQEQTILAKRDLAYIAIESDGDWKPLAAFAKDNPDPKFSLDAHRILAQALEQENELDAAEASFEFVQKNAPNDAMWMNSYAWFLATNDRKIERATELALKASESEPKNPAFLDTLAECYFRAKQFGKAVETQKKAVELITNKKARKDYEERLRKFEEAASGS